MFYTATVVQRNPKSVAIHAPRKGRFVVQLEDIEKRLNGISQVDLVKGKKIKVKLNWRRTRITEIRPPEEKSKRSG